MKDFMTYSEWCAVINRSFHTLLPCNNFLTEDGKEFLTGLSVLKDLINISEGPQDILDNFDHLVQYTTYTQKCLQNTNIQTCISMLRHITA